VTTHLLQPGQSPSPSNDKQEKSQIDNHEVGFVGSAYYSVR